VFFADRGWAPDSPAAQIYERRVRQPDPRGWFSTTNIFGSMMAFGLVVFVGLVIGSVRDRLGGWCVGALCLGAAVSGGALLMTRSKGAVLAAAAGLALLLAPVMGRAIRSAVTRYGSGLALALVAAPLVAVAVRGTVLPESWLGERSLLFRCHYLIGASRVISEHRFAGVGPDGFQMAYTAVREPRSPEEVISAHNVLADWLATLGISGVAWIGLVVVLLWRAGGRCPEPRPVPASGPPRLPLVAAAVVAVLGLLPALAIEAVDLDSLGKELTRGLGILGFVAGAAGMSLLLSRLGESMCAWALGGAVVALLVHAQLEMTFFDPGSVTWMMCVLGLAGGATARPGGARLDLVVPVALLGLAIWLAVGGAARALRAQALINEAAALLHPRPETRREQARDRELAADLLVVAYVERMPTWVMPLEESARQVLLAAAMIEDPTRLELVDRAIELAERAIADHGRATSVALAGEAYWFKATQTDDFLDWQAAIDYSGLLTEIDPHGIGAWRRLGDVLWDNDRREEAAAAYGRALHNSASLQLDPLKQLPDRDRDALRERIETVIGP
jgi:hypothetical protein